MINKYDVIIAGGGVSGAMSAIAAGRAGAKVLIIEQSGFFGGTLTSCGVGPMMTFFAREKQVILGLMQEVVDRLCARGYSPGHVHDTTCYVSYLTPFDAEGLKLVLDEMIEESGCTSLFHTVLAGAQRTGNSISSLTICNKDGISEISADVYIDATGDGDLMAFAGIETTKGRPRDGASQPLTLKMRYCNVDTAALRKYIHKNIHDFPRLRDHTDLLDNSEPLAIAGFDSVFRSAYERSEHEITREDVLMFETGRAGEFILNTTRILGLDSTNAYDLSKAERIGRQQCAELDRFMRKYAPGFENAILMYTGPNVGVRSSRQLDGKYTLTANDVLTAKRFPSVIAHSGYPIDIHNPDGTGTRSHFIGENGGREYYDIPYEIMLPKSVSNLLVTGRCVSADFEAQASIRVTPSAGALGQAAGIAAAIAVNEGISVSDVDVKALQDQLRENNAYIETPQNLPPSGSLN